MTRHRSRTAHAAAWLALAALPPGAAAGVGRSRWSPRSGTELPGGPSAGADVVALLARAAEPGLTAMPSGRFFGFVIGGSHPAALAADWLVSAWDQNAGLRSVTPAHTAVEDVASAGCSTCSGLPADSAVGFVTGGTMANFTCLTAARDEVLRRAGWDVGPAAWPVRRACGCVVGGAARHRRPRRCGTWGSASPRWSLPTTQGRLEVAALESGAVRR